MLEKDFLINLGKKTIVMIGFTYFSVAISTQTFENFMPSLIAGGLYCFTELARYYKVNSENLTLRQKKKKKKEITFLI